MKTREFKDITVSSILLALAFGIALAGGLSAFYEPVELFEYFGMALIGVSLGFILHEMAHRFIARRFGCSAEYVMWPAGLMLALFSSLLGIVFAAPGAVMIRMSPDLWGKAALARKRVGLISIAGPAMNIFLAAIFLVLDYLYNEPGNLSRIFSIGAWVNAFLAVFNLIPIGPLDGAKIFRWDKSIWVVMLIVGVSLLVLKVKVL
jgi:Zn-dependent protease